MNEPIRPEDLSSGRVLYNQPGATSFPVRLASDVFLACKKVLVVDGNNGPYDIYDPCCGGGYLLAAIGFLHGSDIRSIHASDIDQDMIALARRNLSLLSPEGIDGRIRELERLFREYGKESHRNALASARRLRDTAAEWREPIKVSCFRADALRLDEIKIMEPICPDIVLTDVPYGKTAHWSGGSSDNMHRLLSGMRTLLKPSSVVGIVSDKKQAVIHEGYRQARKYGIGNRRVTILLPRDVQNKDLI